MNKNQGNISNFDDIFVEDHADDHSKPKIEGHILGKGDKGPSRTGVGIVYPDQDMKHELFYDKWGMTIDEFRKAVDGIRAKLNDPMENKKWRNEATDQTHN
jgi:hypothetical protein